MIFARDKSQMCNNLLQYAHVYAWGREHGRKVISMRFSYKHQYFKICHTSLTSFPLYLFAKYMAALKLLPTASFKYADCDHKALEEKMLRHKNIVVAGWHVRFYDLFIKYLDDIRDLFTLDSQYTEPVEQKILQIENIQTIPNVDDNTPTNSAQADDDNQTTPRSSLLTLNSKLRLGVHIRRGDYKTWMNGRFYYDDDVYCQYIKRFRELFPDKTIYVYLTTNDPEVSAEKFSEKTGIENIHNLHGSGPEDLYLLSQCDYIIGPPSTFSVVAAMYHNTFFYRMDNADSEAMTLEGFHDFNYWFRRINEL